MGFIRSLIIKFVYISDPESLVGIIINYSKFYVTNGKLMMKRILLIQEYYYCKDFREQLRRLTDELVNLDYESYKEIIKELIMSKTKEWYINKGFLSL